MASNDSSRLKNSMLSASLPRGRRAAGGCDILPELFLPLQGIKVNEEDTTRTPRGEGPATSNGGYSGACWL